MVSHNSWEEAQQNQSIFNIFGKKPCETTGFSAISVEHQNEAHVFSLIVVGPPLLGSPGLEKNLVAGFGCDSSVFGSSCWAAHIDKINYLQGLVFTVRFSDLLAGQLRSGKWSSHRV